jgi:hypothetical protein
MRRTVLVAVVLVMNVGGCDRPTVHAAMISTAAPRSTDCACHQRTRDMLLHGSLLSTVPPVEYSWANEIRLSKFQVDP